VSLAGKLVKYASGPVWSLYDRQADFYPRLARLGTYGRLDRSAYRRRQRATLASLLSHAFRHCPLHAERAAAAGVGAEDIERGADPAEVLRALPLLTREQVREGRDALVARNIDRRELLTFSTGGSTGVPLTFYRDRHSLVKKRVQEIFFDRWMGWDVGERIALFVSPRHTGKGIRGFKARVRNATSTRTLAFDPYRINEPYMEEFLRLLRRHPPRLIKCFPNSLYCFAEFLAARGIDDIRPAAVSCTGETLHPYQKQLFEQVFRCPIFEKYGTIDCGVVASECREHDGMHVFMDGAFVELLDHDGRPAAPGQPGQVVITDLYNRGMPLLRYVIGDLARASDRSCPCGSELELIEGILGRDRDIIWTAAREPRPGYLFVEVFHKNDIPGQFQVVQERIGAVTLRIAPHAGYGERHTALLEDRFRELLGTGTDIAIEFVDEIPRAQSGKYLYISSSVRLRG
jgi:phenylacetate-CoA ligase